VGAPGDTATAGLWERAIPQGTAAQPGSQVTPGGQFCFITGAQAGTGVGSFDVDGGATTLTSPRINAVPAGRFPQIISSTLAYSRWYSNNAGASPNADSMPIQISTDDGATWSDLEVVSENRAAWVRREIQLPGEPSAQTRLRFVARDLGAGSVVEAAVDDVSLTQLVCPPDIDINRDENSDLLDAQNLAQVVVGLIQPGPDWLEGDIDGNENVDLQDAQWIAIIVLGL
jgi:aminopeptidase S